MQAPKNCDGKQFLFPFEAFTHAKNYYSAMVTRLHVRIASTMHVAPFLCLNIQGNPSSKNTPQFEYNSLEEKVVNVHLLLPRS